MSDLHSFICVFIISTYLSFLTILCPTGKDSHMSIFVSILQGMYDSLLSWPYRHPVTFILVDQDPDPDQRKHITSTFMPNPIMENNAFLGKPKTFRNPSLGIQGCYDVLVLQ